MPADLVGVLGRMTLVFIKGDANYRRLLLDRRWPVDTAFRNVVSRTGLAASNIVSLRTCKSDPIVGLARDAADALDLVDAQWRVNGVRGVIQACL